MNKYDLPNPPALAFDHSILKEVDIAQLKEDRRLRIASMADYQVFDLSYDGKKISVKKLPVDLYETGWMAGMSLQATVAYVGIQSLYATPLTKEPS